MEEERYKYVFGNLDEEKIMIYVPNYRKNTFGKYDGKSEEWKRIYDSEKGKDCISIISAKGVFVAKKNLEGFFEGGVVVLKEDRDSFAMNYCGEFKTFEEDLKDRLNGFKENYFEDKGKKS